MCMCKRMSVFVVTGMPESEGELESEVISLLNDTLDASVPRRDLVGVHRMGPQRDSHENPRPVLVRALTNAVQRRILALRPRLRQTEATKGKIFINEYLTKDQKKAQDELRPYFKCLRRAEIRCFLRGGLLEIPASREGPGFFFFDKVAAGEYLAGRGLVLENQGSRPHSRSLGGGNGHSGSSGASLPRRQ